LQKVCNEYHACISWRLDDNDEPDLPLPTYDPFAAPVLETLTEEEKVIKHEQIESLNGVRDVTYVTDASLTSLLLMTANSSLAEVQGAFVVARVREQD
jgi:hypothetical protein